MKILDSKAVGLVWVEYVKYILDSGYFVYDAREEILEVGPVYFQISEFLDIGGVISRFGKENIIEVYKHKMFSMDLIEEINSTYGDRFFDNIGINQVDLAVQKLKENPWAKSCFIPLVVPNDPGPRIPCLSALQVAIRNESVQFYATFRSQNAFNAYGNFLGLRAMQEYFSELLSIPAGDVFCSVNFPHIYRSDIPEAKTIMTTLLAEGVL